MRIYDFIDPKLGKAMETVAKTQEPTTEGSIRGHQSVCARLVVREQVIPQGIRLYVQPEHANALGLPCDTTTELAGQLSRELKRPVGVTVMVLCEASALCHTVVQAGREQHVHFASTGRYGKHLFRRRCTPTCVLAKPQGAVGERCIDAGWREVSHLGQRHGVCSRQGSVRKNLGLVTDAPARSGAGRIRTYEERWAVEIV